jgi:hypothetical protein
MPNNQWDIGQKSVGQMPFGQKSVGQIVFDQKSWNQTVNCILQLERFHIDVSASKKPFKSANGVN